MTVQRKTEVNEKELQIGSTATLPVHKDVMAGSLNISLQ